MNRITTKSGFLFILTLILLSCCQDGNLTLVKFSGETQGTYYAVTYYDRTGRNFQRQVDSILERIDQSVSLYQYQSIISRVNRNEPDVLLDEIFVRIFQRSMEVADQSGGNFDPTVGPLVKAWGFSFTDRMKLDPVRIDSLLKLIGYQRVKLSDGRVIKDDPRLQLDFNAIAQGYSVDRLALFMEEQGIKDYLIDIGGEVLGRGHKPDGKKWSVGIERPASDPMNERELKAIVALENEALSTSGNYRKFFEENGVRYSHTIDPYTGYPVRHSLLSVSVKAADCTTADAFATAFMVMGLDRSVEFLKDHPELDAYFIFSEKNGGIGTYMTQGIKEILLEEIPF